MLSPTNRPKVLVAVGSVVLVACCLPLVGAVVGEHGHWLWLVLLSTRRAATTSVAASALAVVVIGVVWWLDERRHAERARAATAWLADVGPSTSTWAPRWVTLGGLGFVALGFVLVFSSGGDDGRQAWGAPEAVAPVVSLVKLVGGLLLLAAPGTLLGGGLWWISRHQVRTSGQVGTRADGAGHDRSPEPGAGQAGAEPGDAGAVATTSFRHLVATGPRRPTWLVVGGAALVALGVLVALVANVAVSVQDFPGAPDTAPPGGLLRCCTFVTDGTGLTAWAVVACFLLWTGLTAVAVGASWWDSERQAARPAAPAWMDGLAADPTTPVAGVFPPTGAPPEPGRAGSATPVAVPTAEAVAESTVTGLPGGPAARWLALAGAVTVVVGALLTVSLHSELVGGVLYLYDAGPAVLGLVFLLPVGLGLVVSGGLWWFWARRDASRTAVGADPA